MKSSFVSLLFLIFCVPILGFGQNPLGAPLVINYGKMVFQGGSRTWAMQQGADGIMYFGNNEGLLSFDGKYWSKYKLPNQTIVRSIHVHADGRIFVGGQGEFGFFAKDNRNQLVYTSLVSLLPDQNSQFADIWHTLAHNNAIYFMSSRYIFCYRADRITVHAAPSEWEFMQVVHGQLYAQDRENGLLALRQNHWHVIAAAATFEGNKIAAMLELPKATVLIGLQNNQQYMLQHDKITAVPKVPHYPLYTPSLAKIDHQKYVVATATEGVQIRRFEDNHLLERIGVNEGLNNKNVSAVFVDQQQNIWVAIDNAISVISYGGGVRYLRPNREYEVTGYSVRVFDQHLYLSSSNGVYVAPLDKQYADQSQSPGEFRLVKGSDNGEAWRLDEINGRLLLSHNSGVYQIIQDQARKISSGVGSWMSLPLSTAYPVHHALVGTYQGFDLLHYNDSGFSLKRRLKGTFDSFRFVQRDDDDQIWASHPYRGIYKVHLNRDTTAYETTLLTEADGLPSTYQNYVFRIGGRIVFATERGVYEYNHDLQRFQPSEFLSIFHGIPVKYLVEDKQGNIWFVSGGRVGVARFNPTANSYKRMYFPEIEGLHTSGFENIYPYDQQNIYIGSEKGAIHINLQKYHENQSKPKVILSKAQSVGAEDSLQIGGYSPENVRVLPAQLNSFHFRFASPNFGVHQNITYSYFLEGYDKDWSQWSTSTEKDYTNLPAGNYEFHVKAMNNFNAESEVVTFYFKIMPPWYKSTAAYLGYALLLAFATFGLDSFQRKKWKEQKQKFDKEMEQLRYIHQLEVEKNEKEIVKLQNEKLQAEVQIKTKELASTSMQLMENTDALGRLKLELSKLSSVDENTDFKRITSLLKDVENNTAHWDQFAAHFDELNDGFFSRLKKKHPRLSRNDLKVCAYLRLNFTSKQIAQLQSISVRGVEIHRYRLRKKLNIPTEVSLFEYMESI